LFWSLQHWDVVRAITHRDGLLHLATFHMSLKGRRVLGGWSGGRSVQADAKAIHGDVL